VANEHGNVLARVSPAEGFLPKFAAEFTEAHGGVGSHFVQATSDYFTAGLSAMWLANRLRSEDDPVALFAPEPARKSITKLLHYLYGRFGKQEVSLALLNEAFAQRAQGSFGALFDNVTAPGSFSEWLAELENANYSAADRLVPNDQ
jgi:hypothetical protein